MGVTPELLLCARYCAKHFIYIILLNPHYSNYELLSVILY